MDPCDNHLNESSTTKVSSPHGLESSKTFIFIRYFIFVNNATYVSLSKGCICVIS
jgi:hypothetical protein